MKKIKILVLLLILITLFSSFTYSNDYLRERLVTPSAALFLGTTSGINFQYLIFDMSIGYHYKELLRFNFNIDLIILGLAFKKPTYIPIGDRILLYFKFGIIYDYDYNNKKGNTSFKLPITIAFLLGDKHEGSKSELFLEVGPVMDTSYTKLECYAGFRFFF